MSQASEKTFSRKATLHSECDCCEHAAERLEKLRRALALIDAEASKGLSGAQIPRDAFRAIASICERHK